MDSNHHIPINFASVTSSLMVAGIAACLGLLWKNNIHVAKLEQGQTDLKTAIVQISEANKERSKELAYRLDAIDDRVRDLERQ